jgi:hypothetical protein
VLSRPRKLGNAPLASAVLLVLTLAGTYKYARVLTAVYPIEQWLFWKLAQLWGWVALFNAACLSVGQLILARVLRLRPLPPLESAVFSIAIGVVAFVLCLYVGGALAWFTPTFAVALPCVFLLIGGRHGWRCIRELIDEARGYVPHVPQLRVPLTFVLTAAGVVCVFVSYLAAMTPDALNYDSTWCHLTVSQDYARAGRIIPFPADYTKNMPQLASMIHTWGWLVPGLDPPLRWMLVMHDEFALFLWTLAGVGAGIRRLLRDQNLRGSWAAFFLFPIIFVYDNNMGGAADHVCAFFSVPLVLATLRVCMSFAPGEALLLGIVAAGGVMTKYQAAYLLVPVGAIVLALALWQLIAPVLGRPSSLARRRVLSAPPLAAAAFLVCVSPHFIRQTIFHHNPLYPFLQNVFTGSTPTLPNAALLFNNTISDPGWIPKGTALERLRHAAKLFFTFSFEPHYSFTHNVPAFGSLFSLLLPAILFVRDRFRTAIAALIASGALAIWALVYNVDRNLQVFMPVMVCVTAALIVKIWQLGWLARLGLVPLVALQIVWGGDALFYSNYSRIDSAMSLIRSGYEGTAATRFNGYRSAYLALGRALPPNARVLLHNSHVNLGIDREIYLDWVGYQALISYDSLHTPAEVYAYFRKLGITHLMYEPDGFRAPTKQQEVLWNAFITRAPTLGRFGSLKLMRMPDDPPPAQAPYRVAAIGLRGYESGIYPIERMNTDENLPSELQHYAAPSQRFPSIHHLGHEQLEGVDAVFVGAHEHLPEAAEQLLHSAYEQILRVDAFTLYWKKP